MHARVYSNMIMIITNLQGYRKAAKEFVATQAPLPDTINDFWRMVWEQKSTVIVMLTNHEERGKVVTRKAQPCN